MAKRQTRKSISVRGDTYSRLKEYCDNNGKAMSPIIEAEIKKFLDSNEQQGKAA